MIVYLDSSVLLRQLFKQPHSITGHQNWSQALTSELTSVEILRSVDRLRLDGSTTDDEVATLLQEYREVMISSLEEIELAKLILKRASEPFPTVVRTLDAIHLASALFWQEDYQKELVFLTHDIQQGIAAKALGMQVEGI